MVGMQRTARIDLDRFLQRFSARPLIPCAQAERGASSVRSPDNHIPLAGSGLASRPAPANGTRHYPPPSRFTRRTRPALPSLTAMQRTARIDLVR